MGKMPSTTHVRGLWLASAVGAAFALLMTWPLARDPGHQVLRAPFFWDAYANSMIMGSRVDAVLGWGPLSLYDDYFFAPLPNTIVFNENHFGLSLIFAPLYVLTQQPLLAYNLTLLSSLVLSVVFTSLLVKRLTGSDHAGILAGVAFAFCPYVFFEIGRIQLVATQWIPGCFLFLHRVVEERRGRDVLLFWALYVLQIGTCLYYAMFLVPLLATAFLVLTLRHRPGWGLFGRFAAGGVLAGGLAFAMVAPYFSAREHFDLERSLSFASNYDGRLSFFGNVSTANHTLTFLHHEGKFVGAHEEIAFPGVLVFGFLLVSAALWTRRRLAVRRFRQTPKKMVFLVVVAAVAVSLTLVLRSMLVGVIAVALAAIGFSGITGQRRRPQDHSLYWGLLLLAVLLFLGLFPFDYDGQPVRGLYYYFHTYFPGFNGIRKVSRQAVMTTFFACVLSGFGAAWVFSKLGRGFPRNSALAGLLALLAWELRVFPHPVEEVWAGEKVPRILRFARTLPKDEFLASVPQNGGSSPLYGDSGMALHNYLALYHKHRFVNGQSSWLPSVTDLALRSVQTLPRDESRRALLAMGTRHLLIYGNQLPPGKRNLAELLDRRPEHYRRVFSDGNDAVFSLVTGDDPSLRLLDTQPLPPGVRLLPREELEVVGFPEREPAALAKDGSLQSRFSTGMPQHRGQYLEVRLDQPRAIAALEIENPGHPFDSPSSFSVLASRGNEPMRVILEQREVRLFAEQVFSPRTFVFRVVFEEPVPLDRLRLTVGKSFAGYYFSAAELRLYER